MISKILLITIVALLLLTLYLVIAYRRRYGYSYWEIFLSDKKAQEKLPLIQTPLSKLGISPSCKRILQTLKHKECNRFLGFRLPSIEQGYCIIVECPSKEAWISVFYYSGKEYLAITGVSKHGDKKIVTISNAEVMPGSVQGKFIRSNNSKYTIDNLFTRLDQLLPQRCKISLRTYIKLSKIIFLQELLDTHRKEISHKQVIIPGRYVQSYQDLISQYAEKYHINERFLNRNTHKILIVNAQTAPDYLVANLVTASSELYEKRKIILANARGIEDINQWFKGINERISKENQFHYLGTIDGESKSDFYYHQHIAVRGEFDS